MYQYKAKLIRVVDGDTVDAMIDCGFSTFKKERIRLYGIDTPECRTRDKEEKILVGERIWLAGDKTVIENFEDLLFPSGEMDKCLPRNISARCALNPTAASSVFLHCPSPRES